MNIGDIGNCYGGLEITENNGRFLWGIEDYDGIAWEEIPRSLFEELRKFEESKAVK
jgi:hypothetical protein